MPEHCTLISISVNTAVSAQVWKVWRSVCGQTLTVSTSPYYLRSTTKSADKFLEDMSLNKQPHFLAARLLSFHILLF